MFSIKFISCDIAASVCSVADQCMACVCICAQRTKLNREGQAVRGIKENCSASAHCGPTGGFWFWSCWMLAAAGVPHWHKTLRGLLIDRFWVCLAAAAVCVRAYTNVASCTRGQLTICLYARSIHHGYRINITPSDMDGWLWLRSSAHSPLVDTYKHTHRPHTPQGAGSRHFTA